MNININKHVTPKKGSYKSRKSSAKKMLRGEKDNRENFGF